MITKHVKILIFLSILALSLSAVGSASSTLDYDVVLSEGDSFWLEDGYVLNIIDIDTYNEYAQISVSWNGYEVHNAVYYEGDYFYYDDGLISLEFDIVDIYSDSYINYMDIEGLYIFYKDFPQGTIVLYSIPDGYDVYLNGYYQATSDGYTLIQLSNLEPGYHSVTLESSSYDDMQASFYVSSGEVQYYSVSDFSRSSTGDFDRIDPTYYDDYDYDDQSSSDNALGAVFLFLLFIFIVFFLRGIFKARKRNKKSKRSGSESFGAGPSAKGGLAPKAPSKPETIPEPIVETEKGPSIPVGTGQFKEAPSPLKESSSIVVKSAFYYRGAVLQYKVKVENHTSEPIGDIRVTLFVPDVFLLKESEKTISMLEPDEGKTVTFEVRPTGECGDCKISAGIDYYDYNTKKRSHVDLEGKMVSVVCPVLHVMQIDEPSWRSVVTTLISAEEDSKDLEIPAENLFDIATRVLKDMNMYMIEPEITSTPSLFTGVARFYAEGVSGLKYASYVEVVGKRRSRLILRAWAEKEDALTGFYHKMLEEIEKRTDIKLFVDEGSTQYNIRTTNITDSLIQRSTIGAEPEVRKCPNCGKEVKDDAKFCEECGEKLD
ncbi:zinc-ribbon domain-containing protein [Methanococcoides methylutens]|uniref:zinc-ribbon domain-containing protein n=1 Tax=Methanococcoides methylutens TaxID=2226 RepID=UPI00404423D8